LLEKSDMTHYGEAFTDFLKKATQKIEELQVQAALGKAELTDYFEELKKESRTEYNDLRAKLNSKIEQAKEKKDEIKGKLEHLELQLALGKAESKEVLEEQKKNLKQAFNEVKDLIEKT
jgi:hypothetical protein